MKKQARFWHWHNGAVKIKLRQGQTLRHSHGGPTDEGWHRENNEWTYDGRAVTCEWSTDGVDCDGRMSRGGVSVCPANRLACGYVDETGMAFPEWQEGATYQRDYAAEAMGY